MDGHDLAAGEMIAIDGSTGAITLDDVPLIEPEISEQFQTVLGWADELRRLSVRANADNPKDAAKAREFGAEGIGLCRTEHMFFGADRDGLVKEMFLAAEEWRRAHLSEDGDVAAVDERFRSALAALKDLQRADFEGIFAEMSGLPVTIRLLDPPLHEFLPVEHFEREQPESAQLVRELQESNPMLGTRGVRLAVLYPPIYEMQVRAIVEAAAAVAAAGEQPQVEIMVPLIAYETELEQVRERIVRVADEALQAADAEVPYLIGTMLELPRACLVADRIARHADFLSFGTNDLTQTAIGLSRDDVEAKFLGRYVEEGIIDRSPFETIDEPGVGELVALGTKRGREAEPGLKVGVCGEHGGDPDSVAFFDRVGLDYVSCSPYRVPIARVAAAQAAAASEPAG